MRASSPSPSRPVRAAPLLVPFLACGGSGTPRYSSTEAYLPVGLDAACQSRASQWEPPRQLWVAPCLGLKSSTPAWDSSTLPLLGTQVLYPCVGLKYSALDLARPRPAPVQTWPGRAQSRRRCCSLCRLDEAPQRVARHKRDRLGSRQGHRRAHRPQKHAHRRCQRRALLVRQHVRHGGRRLLRAPMVPLGAAGRAFRFCEMSLRTNPWA